MAGQILPACVCIASRRHVLSLAGHPERSRNHFVHSWIFLCARCAEFCMKFYERIIAASLPERSFFPASDGESLPLLCLDLFQAQLFSADDGYSPCLFFIILFSPHFSLSPLPFSCLPDWRGSMSSVPQGMRRAFRAVPQGFCVRHIPPHLRIGWTN